ncbi:capsular polysaccharide biosynthesis protein [Phyllobacterium sp. YR531]|uniref:capsular polysaccharide biosynthesis protein n=1 Tax=Phyllobacterium sp. YR531 TaxID=1144343 RepID=UPI00026F8F7B|nr:capsular polysaccharide biosynthesis protein [Phyllobacterium sp. YR531]EJN06068.1 capsule polysaccharide export protein [Phyllobacterium sp. YR531]
MSVIPAPPIANSAPVVLDDFPISGASRGWLPQKNARLLAFTPTLLRFPLIGAALETSHMRGAELPARPADGIVGWGEKPLARMARRLAKLRGLPYWALEDGFLRSVGLGKAGAPGVSIIADDVGIYFNAAKPSRLERLVEAPVTDQDLCRSRSIQQQIVEQRLTKYNHLPDYPFSLAPTTGRSILLIDQVASDYSIAGAGADELTFRQMLHEALAVPGATVMVKSHPDIVAGFARGYLTQLAGEANVHVITENISPHALLDVVDEVWTVSSQFGFDALIRSVPVKTFGVPFYAGWGLTTDWADGPIARAAFSRRTSRPTLDRFVAAALLHYSRYVDPVTRKATTAEKAIDRLIAWRHHALARRGNYLCVGFSKHKHRSVKRFLSGPWSTVRFTGSKPDARELARADYVVRWGQHDEPPVAGELARSVPMLRMEDGFIRSVGLGSHLIPASSLCLDRDGIYFDATRESGLERLLLNTDFTPALLARARRLRQSIVEYNVTKYNLEGTPAPDYRRLAGDKPIVLVAGQVPGDASLRFGLTNNISNIDLLKVVRAQRPQAFIMFKEHPDMLAGRRGTATDTGQLAQYSDLVIGNVSAGNLLSACDEVHVATSLIGFEALMRGRQVWCHGLPFYAGWGLTHDCVTPLRPRKYLTLDALVAATLILYPLYFSTRTNLLCEVEDVIDELYGETPTEPSRLKTALRMMGWS